MSLVTQFKPFESKTQSDEFESNFNNTAFRILFLLKQFVENKKVTLLSLNKALINTPLIARTFTNETLRKYIYTLQRIGFNVKTHSKGENIEYQLLSTPLELKLSTEEQAMLQAVTEIIEGNPVRHHVRQLHEFFEKLAPFCPLDFKNFSESKETNLGKNKAERVVFETNDSEAILKLEQACLKGQVLRLKLNTKSEVNSSRSIMELSPESIRYQNNHVFLVGCAIETRQKTSVNLTDIISFEQLPQRLSPQALQTTVVFKLSGRIARNYHSHPRETSLTQGDSLIIKVQTDELEPLLLRLLKYGEFCEIVLPQSVKQKFQQKVSSLLETLETPETDEDKQFVTTKLGSS